VRIRAAPRKSRRLTSVIASKAFTVGEIRVDGTQVTSPELVQQVLNPIKDAKDFVGVVDAINAGVENLKTLDVFNKVNVVIDSADTGTLDLDVKVEEKGRSAVTAGAVIVGNKAKMQSKVKIRNVFGRGESLNIGGDLGAMFGEWGSGKFGEITVGLDKPVMFGRITDNLNVYCNSGENDCLGLYGWSETRFGAGAALTMVRGGVEHLLKASLRDSSISWPVGTPNVSALEPGTHVISSSLIHRMTFDSRLPEVIPGAGAALRITNELCGFPHIPDMMNMVVGQLTGPQDKQSKPYQFHKITAEAKAVFPLADCITLNTELTGGLITPLGDGQKDIFAPDRFYLGGPSPMRGFVESAFGRVGQQHTSGGSAFLTAAAMLRYPFETGLLKKLNANAQVFVNGGNLIKTADAKNMKAGEAWPALVGGLHATAGVGMVFPLGETGRVEFNFCQPIGMSEAQVTSMTQRFQLGFNVDWM